MDLSMSSYLLVIPLFLWGLKPLLQEKLFIKTLGWYQMILIFLIAILQAVDLEIFKNWGHRIDAAILPFLKYPSEAIASAGSSPFRLLFTITGLNFVAASMFWVGITQSKIKKVGEKNGGFQFFSALFFLVVLILPIRGGIQLTPINQSAVYFSTNRNLNFAAENPAWVLFQSIIESGNQDNLDERYTRFPKTETEKLINELYQGIPAKKTFSVLKKTRPNIVLIVWESLTSKVVGSFGGAFPSTPNLDKLSNQSLSFQKFFASGDRSDKGLASLLSGVPAVGRLSIMTQPNQVMKLPFLPRVLKKEGYHSTYLYGGDLEFSNMKSFMLEAGFDRMVGKENFPPNPYPSKWGIHDEYVFSKQLEIADMEKTPFFHTLFTLSSHEPFEFPGSPMPDNQPIDTLLCRAHRYTDNCFGNWLEKAKKTDWWPNTLVVIVADHGHSFPKQSADNDPWKFKIPMVWTGGALSDSAKISFLGAGTQTDFAATLLSQMNLDARSFRFSRNLLAIPNSNFVYFAYRNGNGFYRYSDEKATEDQSAGNKYQQAVYEELYKP